MILSWLSGSLKHVNINLFCLFDINETLQTEDDFGGKMGKLEAKVNFHLSFQEEISIYKF